MLPGHKDTPVFNYYDKGKEPNKLFGANPDSNVEFIHFCFRTIFVYHSVFIFAWDLFYSVFFHMNHQESFLLCWHTNMLNNMFIDKKNKYTKWLTLYIASFFESDFCRRSSCRYNYNLPHLFFGTQGSVVKVFFHF